MIGREEKASSFRDWVRDRTLRQVLKAAKVLSRFCKPKGRPYPAGTPWLNPTFQIFFDWVEVQCPTEKIHYCRGCKDHRRAISSCRPCDRKTSVPRLLGPISAKVFASHRCRSRMTGFGPFPAGPNIEWIGFIAALFIRTSTLKIIAHRISSERPTKATIVLGRFL